MTRQYAQVSAQVFYLFHRVHERAVIAVGHIRPAYRAREKRVARKHNVARDIAYRAGSVTRCMQHVKFQLVLLDYIVLSYSYRLIERLIAAHAEKVYQQSVSIFAELCLIHFVYIHLTARFLHKVCNSANMVEMTVSKQYFFQSKPVFQYLAVYVIGVGG